MIRAPSLPTSDIWRLRSDLRFHWVEGTRGSEGYWVVKDPLAAEWFCVSQIERDLLGLADGCRSLADLCRDAMGLLGPLDSSVEAMASFYSQARRKGLLTAVARGPAEKAVMRSQRGIGQREQRHFLNKLLAFRFPGFNPNSIPGLSESWRRAACSRSVAIVVLGVAIVAFAIVVSRFDLIAAELSLAWTRRSPAWFALILIAIAFAKSIHELAHVAACRAMGAECREIGVMLLFGTPCLYCDVSDLWTVPHRSRRVFVSAAGILAELVLAAFATIIWAMTNASLIHDLALTMMMVCSVSTVLVNANPLLRYDGYFILADWIGVPNLASNSVHELRRIARRVVWGRLESSLPTRQMGRSLPPAVLLGYASMSGIYRVFVILMISLLVSHASAAIGAGWIGMLVGCVLIASIAIRSTTQVLSRPTSNESNERERIDDVQQQHWWQRPRCIAVLSAFLVLTTALLTIPFPARIVVPALIVAGEQSDLYASEMGLIVNFAESGTMVRRGDVLFELKNRELEAELQRADAELAESKAIVEAWRSRRGARSGSSTALAVALKRMESARQTRRHAAERVDRLTVHAPQDGQFNHADVRDDLVFERGFHSGTLVLSGSPLGSVGQPDRRAGLALVSQDQIDAIERGQDVRLRHASLATGGYAGQVWQVDRSAMETIPPELLAATIESSAPANPTEAMYLVRVAQQRDGWREIPIRSVVPAEIAIGNQSLWNRLRRLMLSQFRGL